MNICCQQPWGAAQGVTRVMALGTFQIFFAKFCFHPCSLPDRNSVELNNSLRYESSEGPMSKEISGNTIIVLL